MRSETLIMSEGEVCNNTTFETALQLIQLIQLMQVKHLVSEDGARLDIAAEGF